MTHLKNIECKWSDVERAYLGRIIEIVFNADVSLCCLVTSSFVRREFEPKSNLSSVYYASQSTNANHHGPDWWPHDQLFI